MKRILLFFALFVAIPSFAQIEVYPSEPDEFDLFYKHKIEYEEDGLWLSAPSFHSGFTTGHIHELFRLLVGASVYMDYHYDKAVFGGMGFGTGCKSRRNGFAEEASFGGACLYVGCTVYKCSFLKVYPTFGIGFFRQELGDEIFPHDGKSPACYFGLEAASRCNDVGWRFSYNVIVSEVVPGTVHLFGIGMKFKLYNLFKYN